jgi:hypothetical protein
MGLRVVVGLQEHTLEECGFLGDEGQVSPVGKEIHLANVLAVA